MVQSISSLKDNIVMCMIRPKTILLLLWPYLGQIRWAVVLFFPHNTEAALCSSLPSINLCHKSVRQKEKELLNTDLSAINLTSITRLGYCVLYTGEQWATLAWTSVCVCVCVCAFSLCFLSQCDCVWDLLFHQNILGSFYSSQSNIKYYTFIINI